MDKGRWAKQDECARRVATIEGARKEAIIALADDLRETLVVPLCDRFKLRFIAGNGTWFFVKGNHYVSSVSDIAECKRALSREAKDALSEAIPVLRVSVGNFDIGCYVCSYGRDPRSDT